MWTKCKSCGEVHDHEVTQLMNNQAVCLCRRCNKLFVADMKSKDRVSLTITLSGERACGKTTTAYFLKGILEQLGANVELIIPRFHSCPPERDSTVYAAAPKRFDRMTFKIVEMPNTPTNVSVAEKNLRIFHGRDDE